MLSSPDTSAGARPLRSARLLQERCAACRPSSLLLAWRAELGRSPECAGPVPACIPIPAGSQDPLAELPFSLEGHTAFWGSDHIFLQKMSYRQLTTQTPLPRNLTVAAPQSPEYEPKAEANVGQPSTTPHSSPLPGHPRAARPDPSREPLPVPGQVLCPQQYRELRLQATPQGL